MFVGRLQSVLLLCVFLPGCKERAHQKGPMLQPSKAAPAGFAVDTSQAVAVPLPEKWVLRKPAKTTSVIKANEAASPQPAVMPAARLQLLEASLPKLEKARSLEDLRVIPQSRMARQVLCFEQGVEEATSELLRAYRLADWDEITVTTPSHDEHRRSFSASSDDFRLSGSAYQGPFKGCEQASGFTRVSLSFHDRLEDRTSDAAGKDDKPRRATLADPRATLRAKRSVPEAE